MRDDEALVTIAVFDTVLDASIARGALEAAGIDALVPEEMLARPPVTGSLQVFESDKNRAVAELRRRQIRLVGAPIERE